LRISKFWKNPWIFASRFAVRIVRLRRRRTFNGIFPAIQNRETFFKLTLFRYNPLGQKPADFLVKQPKVVNSHRFKIDFLHQRAAPVCVPDVIFVPNGLFESKRWDVILLEKLLGKPFALFSTVTLSDGKNQTWQ
jgi:hypothetical protein